MNFRRVWFDAVADGDTVKANSHVPCHAYAAPKPRCAVALRSRFQNGIVVAWRGHGTARHV
jgi:hypothetical protein